MPSQQLRTTATIAKDAAAACSVPLSVAVDATDEAGKPIIITSTGTVPALSVSETVKGAASRQFSPFPQAVYGVTTSSTYGGIRIFGSYPDALVDSYDSRLGAYGAALSGNPVYGSVNKSHKLSTAPYSCIGCHANIRTNSTASGIFFTAAIDVEGGGSKVFGSAARPAGGVIYNTGTITGAQEFKPAQTFPTPTPPSAPGGCVNLVPANYVVSGSMTDEMRPDTAYCADSLTVKDGATLRFPNLTTLYVTGNVDIQNGGTLEVGQGTIRAGEFRLNYMMTASTLAAKFQVTTGKTDIYAQRFSLYRNAFMNDAQKKPELLRLWDSGPVTAMQISGFSKLYGTVYAPLTSVDVGDSEVYGAIIGLSFDLGGSLLHYDEGLTDAQDWPVWLVPATADVHILAQY